jgi:two-component system, LuxR family, response regulator FixJ
MAKDSPDVSIHIVDDDDAVRDSLQLLLGLTYGRVRAFESAIGFLTEVESDLPDCLILDIHMPEKTGLEVMRELMRKSIIIPTILITGKADTKLRLEAIAKGAVAILDKPLDHDMLIHAIERGRRRLPKGVFNT